MTPYGQLLVRPMPELFAEIVKRLATAAATRQGTIGLTGGSTPKAFYQWSVETQAIAPEVIARATWTVSDERYVPLGDEESNFGNADRMLLTPLGVPAERKMPFITMVDPHSAADAFNRQWREQFDGRGLELCILGMGDDGHTASLFPGSPHLSMDVAEPYTPVEVPGKGWRLTITRTGLERAAAILVVVTGAAKAERIHSVMTGSYDPEEQPAQILRATAAKTTWLLDEAAAARLG